MTDKKLPPVVLSGAVALFVYRYFMRVSPPGPASEKVFQIVRKSLKRGLDDSGIDAQINV